MSSIETNVKKILNWLKHSNEFDLIMDELIVYFNMKKEYVEQIIEGISNFFTHETSINEIYFYKILNIFCKKLEESNLSQISFINKIFPILMDKVFNFKLLNINKGNKLFDTLSDFIRKLGNNTEIIDNYLNIIFDKLVKEENEFI